MNSKTVAGVLVAGTLFLGGGSALAAMLPSRHSGTPTLTKGNRDTSATSPSRQALPGVSRTSGRVEALPSSSPTVFTVEAGDNLKVVARWFSDHGFIAEWTANESTLASESHLLFPGERIIVARGTVVIAPPAR
jgi:hypothetical protein